MNILFAASECAPFIKTGGLGDVIGALPQSLLEKEVNVSVIIPKYGDLPIYYQEKMEWIKSIEVPLGWRNQFCGIEKFEYEGISVYFLDNEYYFKRHGSYGFGDDGERFAFFTRAVLEALPYLEDKPDIIHCHDWQTGLIPVLLKAHYKDNPYYQSIKTVFTIHNLRYQGVFPKSVLSELLDLSEQYFRIDGLEFFGNVSYLKGGLAFADRITTVSATYASEIQTSYYGENLDGFLRKKGVHGIVNGIDNKSYDPKNDELIFLQYDSHKGKAGNKKNLQESLGLPVNVDIPIIAMVTRLVDQKGIDLIQHVFHEIIGLNVQFILLGTGDQQYEDSFRYFADYYPDKVSANLYFDEAMARKIYAGSDLFLMPSKFEPCGIGQLLALRYGTLPLVRETGGLKDTVISYNEITDEGNGFSFENYNAHDLMYTIERAVKLYRSQPSKWSTIVERAMKLDFSWSSSSEQYLEIYKELLLDVREDLAVK
ncbi:glycogen synthase GlgA [Paenisporosarcina sp. TG20]|uniref:glycogen synthase GlgA n=1 Tax=Paenisporosarcina sp. TG20 TaxID=1211706 RepID=UPI0003075B1B|nr:glycogen synthase GlgA [Paenisporosarcina sp. TG20]